MERDRICEWLGLTEQQRRILEVVMSLRAEGIKAGPGEIRDGEAELSGGATIQKSNFFGQLKRLREMGYLRKAGPANYDVNLAKVKEQLGLRKERALKETEELARAVEKPENSLFRLSENRGLEVTFLPGEAWQERFADMATGSKRCLITGVFPKMVYGHSPLFMESEGGRKYSSRLWDLCVRKKTLSVAYLTRLDTDYLLKNLRNAGASQAAARAEVGKLLESVRTLLRSNKNLEIYYSPDPYGIDIGMPNADKLSEFFLFFRNRDKDEIGSVYLNSRQTARQFKDLFERECARSVDLRSPEGQAIIEKKLKAVSARK